MTRDPNHLLSKITAFKKVRAYLELDEVGICSKCVFKDTCKLKDKVPENKVTSSGDVINVMYMMVKHAEFEENLAEDALNENEGIFENENNGKDEVSEEEDLERYIKAEANRQMRDFIDSTDKKELLEEVRRPVEEEMALYLSGIRLLDGLNIIVPKSIQEKEEILELLEAGLQEFTVKKKVDSLFRLQRSLDRTVSKQKLKRDESRGIHELIEVAGKAMKTFEKPVSSSK